MGRRESKYCEKCGCYVPEGETVCVSCGYDPTPKPVRRPDPLADMYAQKQVMLHEFLWAKGGKGNSSIVTTPNCIKNEMDRNCLELCEYCSLE